MVLTTAVLGPMVYAAAYCPIAFKPTLEEIGFDGGLLPLLHTNSRFQSSLSRSAPVALGLV